MVGSRLTRIGVFISIALSGLLSGQCLIYSAGADPPPPFPASQNTAQNPDPDDLSTKFNKPNAPVLRFKKEDFVPIPDMAPMPLDTPPPTPPKTRKPLKVNIPNLHNMQQMPPPRQVLIPPPETAPPAGEPVVATIHAGASQMPTTSEGTAKKGFFGRLISSLTPGDETAEVKRATANPRPPANQIIIPPSRPPVTAVPVDPNQRTLFKRNAAIPRPIPTNTFQAVPVAPIVSQNLTPPPEPAPQVAENTVHKPATYHSPGVIIKRETLHLGNPGQPIAKHSIVPSVPEGLGRLAPAAGADTPLIPMTDLPPESPAESPSESPPVPTPTPAPAPAPPTPAPAPAPAPSTPAPAPAPTPPPTIIQLVPTPPPAAPAPTPVPMPAPKPQPAVSAPTPKPAPPKQPVPQAVASPAPAPVPLSSPLWNAVPDTTGTPQSTPPVMLPPTAAPVATVPAKVIGPKIPPGRSAVPPPPTIQVGPVGPATLPPNVPAYAVKKWEGPDILQSAESANLPPALLPSETQTYPSGPETVEPQPMPWQSRETEYADEMEEPIEPESEPAVAAPAGEPAPTPTHAQTPAVAQQQPEPLTPPVPPAPPVRALSDESKQIVERLHHRPRLEKPREAAKPVFIERARDLTALDQPGEVSHESTGIKIEIKPPRINFNYELEKAYNALIAGQTDVAIGIYKRVLDNDTNNKNALFGLATTYHRAGQIALARPMYARLLAVDPGHSDGLNNFLVLLADESPEQALQELLKLAQSNPQYSALPAQIAVIYQKLGYFDLATEYMQRAIGMAPENLTYRYNYAIMLDKQHKYAEAAELYRLLIQASQRGETIPGNVQKIQQRLTFISSNSRS